MVSLAYRLLLELRLTILCATSICFAMTQHSAVKAQDVLVVTSERRPQPIEETAQSISLIGSKDLRSISADHVSEALARAPGVNLHRGSGAEHLTAIRSPILTSGAGAGSFLYLENGVPLRAAGFANINGLFDAHYEIANAIEIVRGPSGALYGANAIHGVINVITPMPQEGFFTGSEIFGDTQDRYKVKGIVSGGGTKHHFLAGLSVITEAGYRDDAGLDQQKLTVRHSYEGDSFSADTVFFFGNLEQETAGFIFGKNALRDVAQRRTNDFPFAYRDAKSVRLQSTIEVPIGSNITIRTTPYGRWNEMAFPQHFLPSNALETNSHWSIGAQTALYWDAENVSLIAGVDAEVTRGTLREFQERPRIFSFTPGLHYDYEVEAMSASAFAQAKIRLSDKTRAIAAARVDGVRYDYDNLTDSGIVGRFLRPQDRQDDYVTISPKFSILHDLSRGFTGYASYARGARPPQTTDLYRLQINQTGDRARPELIDAGEVGVRAQVGDVMKGSLAGYAMAKRNYFFRDADGFNVANGKTRHIGVEAEIELLLHEAITLTSAFSYAAHTYGFDRITGNAAESIEKGDDVDTAPRIVANTRLKWRPIERASLEAEWVSIGSYFTDAANDHSYDGHNLLHLRGEALLTDELQIFASIRNVANALYAERADFAFGRERFFPGEERTFGVGLRYAR